MLRVWQPQSTMGVSDIWYLDMPRMFRQTSRFGRTSVVRALYLYGQVEGCGAGEDESRRQQERSGVLREPTRLG